jgi:hypothetical protein
VPEYFWMVLLKPCWVVCIALLSDFTTMSYDFFLTIIYVVENQKYISKIGI